MAEFNSYLLGKARKSVGNITLCYTRGKNIAKAKVFSRKDNSTPEILAQRARMKALVQLSRQLLPVIRKGFAGIGRGDLLGREQDVFFHAGDAGRGERLRLQ